MGSVFITGGSRGIGAAAVRAFCARGDRVAFLYEKEDEKAQAVAARTYALKKMSVQAATYDVVDTTSDQVYNGTPSGNARCAQAVQETSNIIGTVNGEYMASYYTASNGGQTDLGDTL